MLRTGIFSEITLYFITNTGMMELPPVIEYIRSRRDNETKSTQYFRILKRHSAFNLLFMFLSPLYFLFSSTLLAKSFTFAFASVAVYWLILLLLYYARFTAERKYRKLSIGYLESFGKLPVFYSYLKFGVFSMILFISLLITTDFTLNLFEEVILLQVFLVTLWFLMFYNLWLRNSTRHAQPMETNELLAKLNSITSSEKMPGVVPLLVPAGKSKVANAYCTGVLKNTIYITDYLYNNLNAEESACILAHEIGHMKHKDNRLSFFLSLIPFVFAEYLIIMVMLNASGFIKAHFYKFYFPLLFALSVLVFFLVPVIIAKIRKMREFRADRFASKHCDPDHLAIALIKASDLNMTPITLEVGSHPSVKQRIDKILAI